MGLHDRDNQGVAGEEFELLAREGRGLQGRGDGNRLDVQ